jgi:hypothetical protein
MTIYDDDLASLLHSLIPSIPISIVVNVIIVKRLLIYPTYDSLFCQHLHAMAEPPTAPERRRNHAMTTTMLIWSMLNPVGDVAVF